MSEDELDIIEWLRRSKNALGQIYPILVKKGSVFEIIDGKHRSQADPTWHRVEIEPPKDWPFSEKAYYLAVRIAANYRRRVSRKERQTEFLMLASQLEEEGVSREKIVSTISKITGFSERWVQKLLPPKYKAAEKAHKKKVQKKAYTGDELIRHPKIEEEDAKIVTNKASEQPIVVEKPIPPPHGAFTPESVKVPASVPIPVTKKPKPRPKLPRFFACPRCHVEIKTVYCTKCFSELEVREIARILKKVMEASE